jgi:DNA mismatch repair protein MutS
MSKLIKQYSAIKEKYKDALLLFRVGDFYQTFDRDADIIGEQMKIMVVETDDKGDIKKMAGVPFYSLDNALRILTKAGYKVAVCDPLEDPKTAKGIKKRDVTNYLKN